MSRISLSCLVLVCCLSLFFSDVLCAPAYAASIVAYEPYEYVAEVVNNGATNRVTFLFADIPHLIDVWEQPSGKKTKQENVTSNFTYKPSYDTITSIRFRIFLLGVEQWDNKSAIDNAVIDIGDIVPGETLDASMTFHLDITRIYNGSSSDPSVGETTLTGRYNFGFYTFDENGQFLTSKWGGASSSAYEFGVTQSHVYNPSYSCSFDPSVRYICPFLDFEFADTNHLNWWLFQVRSEPFNLTCDVSAVHHDSQTMQQISSQLGDISDQLGDIDEGIKDTNDKLDDVNQSIQDNGDKLDDVNQSIQQGNDKLDDIYTGGDAGKDLGDAGDKLSGSSGAVSDAVGGMSDDIGNVSDFEQGQFDHIEYAFDQLAIVQEFGQFNTSLAFVSSNLQEIFSELEGWQLVITLPLFIGLFFGLCQHVGGISHVRAVHAREARNDELHQARLDKIRGGK